MKIFEKDFREFIELLNKNNVEYLLVGGYALALHGHIRATFDIDFWVNISINNADKIIIVLKEFGFSSLDIKVSDFTDKGSVVQLGQPPFRIDIINDIDGLEFKECFEKREIVEIEGLKINLIDIESLKKNKLSTGRTKDKADAEALE
ncbi:MAG: nucleotidyltransferase [Bacteroidota bacterium]|nr:nucleotidyltransferase [Bacteroidota bacterium]